MLVAVASIGAAETAGLRKLKRRATASRRPAEDTAASGVTCARDSTALRDTDDSVDDASAWSDDVGRVSNPAAEQRMTHR
jgi:hypothetical protein